MAKPKGKNGAKVVAKAKAGVTSAAAVGAKAEKEADAAEGLVGGGT